MAKTYRAVYVLTLLILGTALTACADHVAGPATGNITLDVRPQFMASRASTLPINRIVITARTVTGSQLVGSIDRVVDPAAAHWDLPLEIDVGPASTEVALAIELMSVNGTTQSVEWSGIAFVTVAAGQQKAITDVPLYPGSLAPVEAVAILPASAAIQVGRSIALKGEARDARGNVLARPFTWSSADTTIASISATGLVTGKRSGSTVITARAEGKATTATVTVYAPVATGIVKVSGDGQSANASASLAGPLVIRVVDQAGNGISGYTVQWVVTAGGGIANPAASTSDATGICQTTYTAGTLAGASTIEARAIGLTGSPVVFTASVLPQAPVATITLSPASRTLTGGDTLRITATAVDAAGNTLSGALYAWSSSDSTIARVSTTGFVTALRTGIASIRATSNAKVGVATITVVTGPARTLGIYSGNNQVAHTGSRLGADNVVKVIDAGGNGVLGVDVIFTVLGGGGTVTQRTVRTDSAGLAATGWTLGTTLGTQTLEAAVTGLAGSPVNFIATGSGNFGVRRTWTGGDAASPDDWSIANNWSPIGVPSSIDTAVIVPASRQPAVHQNVVVGALIVQTGASIDNGGYDIAAIRLLSVSGNAIGIGSFSLTGANSILRGNFTNLYVSGTAVAVNVINVSGTMLIGGPGAVLTLAGYTINAGNELSVSGGTLVLTNATDEVNTRNFSIGNTNETGKLTAGIIRVSGNFVTGCYNSTEFAPSGTRVLMNGTTPQIISMCSSPTGNRFGDLTISAGSNVTTNDLVYIDTFTITGTMNVSPPAIVDVRVLTISAGGVLNNNGVTRTNLPFTNNGTVNGKPVVQR